MPSSVLTFAGTLGVALCLTPLLRLLALRGRRPDERDSGRVPTTGGLAIFAAVSLVYLVLPPSLPAGFWLGALGVVLTGLIDDFRPLSPIWKLVLQVVSVTLAVAFGVRLQALGIPLLDALLTGCWLVWMCNALNVLDMMDGLAAGVGAIASAALAGLAHLAGAPNLVLLGAGLAGGLSGFLVYNAHPARIYMGDSGSLFTGFVLGAMAAGISGHLPPVQGLVCPLMILGVPFFEAAFLCVVRPLRGVPVMQSSPDHVALRLVARGCSVRGAVWRLYASSLVLAALGLLGARGPAFGCWLILGCVSILALGSGFCLARIDVERA
ncbi:MAG: MraY family glycosyltransferase [Candidatus Latescibacteria bacterium]|nr:MraY family glycosyltransferase [Candidatus Latescibacterota bacterium]